MKTTIRSVLNSVRGRTFNKNKDLFTLEEEEEMITDVDESRGKGRGKTYSESSEYLGNKGRRNNLK